MIEEWPGNYYFVRWTELSASKRQSIARREKRFRSNPLSASVLFHPNIQVPNLKQLQQRLSKKTLQIHTHNNGFPSGKDRPR